MKKHFALFLIVLMAVSIVSAAGAVSAAKAAPTPKLLDTPVMLSPPDGYVIPPNFPYPTDPDYDCRQVALSWTPVRHATTYTVNFVIYWSDGTISSYAEDTHGKTTWDNHNGCFFMDIDKIVWSVQAVNDDTSGGWAGAKSGWSESYTFFVNQPAPPY